MILKGEFYKCRSGWLIVGGRKAYKPMQKFSYTLFASHIGSHIFQYFPKIVVTLNAHILLSSINTSIYCIRFVTNFNYHFSLNMFITIIQKSNIIKVYIFIDQWFKLNKSIKTGELFIKKKKYIYLRIIQLYWLSNFSEIFFVALLQIAKKLVKLDLD